MENIGYNYLSMIEYNKIDCLLMPYENTEMTARYANAHFYCIGIIGIYAQYLL